MKAYIHTDIEGVAGWVYYTNRGHFYANWEHTQRMNRLLTNEVIAAANALEECGVTEIYVNDAHGPAYNIFFEDLPNSCRVIHGRPGTGPHWIPMIDRGVEFAIAIGQHAMAGTPQGLCNHSIWHLTDGEGTLHHLSETTMFAAMAAKYDVPLIMVSGDNKITEEVTSKIPGCVAAVVKEALALEKACTLTPRASCALIKEKVREAFGKRNEIKPLRYKGPFTLNVSDRDPGIFMAKETLSGDEIFELVIRVAKSNGANYGNIECIDDRSFRWPQDPCLKS